MGWAVGLTLHPGKSYIEASFRMINRTPVPTSMLSFSNVAVHVNDNYQIIFPPSTQFVTFHAKRDFTTWPMRPPSTPASDFTTGVDVSWYKNHYSATSMFAWNYQDDFSPATTTAETPASSASPTTMSFPARSSGPGATVRAAWRRKISSPIPTARTSN